MTRLLLFLAASFVLLAAPGPLAARPFEPWLPMIHDDDEEDAGDTTADAKSPFKKWSEVTKDAETREGLFTLYEKREELYAEIKTEDLDRDYLIALSIGRGLGTRFVLGGLPFGTTLVRFARVGDHVHLVQPNTRFVGDEGSAISRAVDLSFGDSVIESFAIESEKDSSAVLINLGKFLKSDYPDAGFFLGLVMDTGMRLDGDRTYIERFKNFPENLEVDVTYSFTPTNRRDFDLDTVSDSRFVPLTIHYSMSVLPDSSTYVPRYADTRVGYFLTAHKDFSNPDDEGYFRRFVDRWHLEKKDPDAAVSDPVEPIVFYLDATIPEAYRPYVREGIEAWQPAFEEAGFSNAIVARDYPEDDPDFDPEDVRYNTIRWITSSDPSFGAIGPRRVDPRTGQILDADILFEDAFVENLKRGYTRLIRPRDFGTTMDSPLSLLGADVEKLWNTPGLPEVMKDHVCAIGGIGAALNGSMMAMSLMLQGQIAPGEPVPMEYAGEALRNTVMHEVGHSIGLRHNFQSSVDVPFERLHDRAYVEANGLTGSVMDYPPPNIATSPEEQGYYHGPTIGTYDRWAIRYGYTPFGASHPNDEIEALAAIAAESAEPGHRYATDEDTYPSTAPDPTSAIWDLGSDPVAFAERRLDLTDGILKHEDFESLFLVEGDNFTKLRRAMSTILGNRYAAVAAGVKYMGGARVARDHYGTPNARPPLMPITKSEQERALDLIVRGAFREDAFDIPAHVLDRLATSRWTHWGMDSFSSRFDFPLHSWASFVQGAAIAGLLSPTRLTLMEEAEYKHDDVLTMAELFDRLSSEIFSELASNGGSSISSLRRGLQETYLDRLVTLTVTPPMGTPEDARALARYELTQLERRIRNTLGSGRPGGMERAHLSMMKARIDQALDAKIDATL